MKIKLLFLVSIIFLFCNMIHAQNPPTALAKNITVKLDANGNVTVNAADLDNGSADNIGIASYMLTTAAVGTSCATVNENQTLTLTAPAGAVFSAINFASFGTPNGSCGNFTLGCHSPNSKNVVSNNLLNQNSGSILADNGVFISDPCPNTPKRLYVEAFYQPSTAVIQPSMSFSCTEIGDHIVNLIVTDTEGNKKSATATITVVDDLAPVMVCNTNIEVNSDPGICGAVVTFTAPAVTDNCTSSIPVVATFTNAGATGRFGPTQAQVNAAYGAGVVTINTQGIQEWKVPKTGKYSIQALGASGGNAPASNFIGGNGANISGEVDLTAGEIIKIVVGQQGQATSDNYGAGGGGGSFVTTFTNTAIVVAGGGGGAGLEDDASKEASITTTANNGENGGNGGTALNGGNVGSGNYIAGAGGGGFNTNGSDGLERPSKGGISFLNGAVGGLNQDGSNGGGFGGGGGGADNCGYGGGGGGYAGGGPAGYDGGCGGNGGGAGSFNSGANQNNTGGSNSGMGKVVITLLSAPIVPSQTDVTGLTSGSVFPVGTTTLKYTATDKSGNSSSCSFDITVKDIEKPVITCAANQTQTADAGVCSAVVTVTAPTATDNCAVVSLANDFNGTPDASGTYPVGTTTVKWTATDAAGNFSECTQQIIVNDAELPVVLTKNFTAQLDALGNATIQVADIDDNSTDNCGIATIELDVTSFTCANVGANTVQLKVTDIHTNYSIATATVTVEDKIVPIVVVKNITVQLDATGNATIVAADIDDNSTDNCGIAKSELNITSFTCANIGPNTVQLKVTDNSGNFDMKDAIVTVEDKIAPTILTKNIIVQLDASGVVTIQAADLDNGSTDICETPTLTVSQDTFTCANIGNNTVTLTATDASGNTSSQTATVKVENNIVPNVLTKNIIVQLNATGNVSIVAADIDNGSTYACGNPTLTVSPNTFTCANVGANLVTLTATDAYGNVSSKTATVTIQDKIAATALAKDLTIQLDATGNATITAAQIDNGSTDLCGIASVTVTPNTFSCNNVGPNLVTLTVTDVNGNKSSATATVTVQDIILPIAKTKDLTVELDDAGNVSITENQINNASSDNCSIATVTLDKLAFNCTNVGVNTVVLTVKDKSGNTATATAKVTVVNKAGDNDNDGIPDNCDNDDDNDGVSDTSDNCPITANPHQEDRNNNGIGDACDKDQLNISQAFTPNGDGINDTWVISNIENHPNSVVRVFNRWGTEVFTARNYQNDWDGHYKGNSSSLPESSSYYYQIDLDGDGSIDKEGWIYINR
ncbi:MAG: HYR domain-containing protein [Flavobacterium sp.]